MSDRRVAISEAAARYDDARYGEEKLDLAGEAQGGFAGVFRSS